MPDFPIAAHIGSDACSIRILTHIGITSPEDSMIRGWERVKESTRDVEHLDCTSSVHALHNVCYA